MEEQTDNATANHHGSRHLPEPTAGPLARNERQICWKSLAPIKASDPHVLPLNTHTTDALTVLIQGGLATDSPRALPTPITKWPATTRA